MWIEIKIQHNGLFTFLDKKTGAEIVNLTKNDVIAKIKYMGEV